MSEAPKFKVDSQGVIEQLPPQDVSNTVPVKRPAEWGKQGYVVSPDGGTMYMDPTSEMATKSGGTYIDPAGRAIDTNTAQEVERK